LRERLSSLYRKTFCSESLIHALQDWTRSADPKIKTKLYLPTIGRAIHDPLPAARSVDDRYFSFILLFTATNTRSPCHTACTSLPARFTSSAVCAVVQGLPEQGEARFDTVHGLWATAGPKLSRRTLTHTRCRYYHACGAGQTCRRACGVGPRKYIAGSPSLTKKGVSAPSQYLKASCAACTVALAYHHDLLPNRWSTAGRILLKPWSHSRAIVGRSICKAGVWRGWHSICGKWWWDFFVLPTSWRSATAPCFPVGHPVSSGTLGGQVEPPVLSALVALCGGLPGRWCSVGLMG
jgi:hypothetical protein